MLRSMFQIYVKGSAEAAELYQKAFGVQLTHETKQEDGSYLHAELDLFGQTLAISESDEQGSAGSTMQFCLHFGEGGEKHVRTAYEALRGGAKIEHELGPCFFSPCMFGLVDRFGVNWCLFV